MRVNSSRSASRVDTAAPSPAATIHASRAAPRQNQHRTVLAPRRRPGETHSESGRQLRCMCRAAKNHRGASPALRCVCSSPLAGSVSPAVGRARRPAFAAGAARAWSASAGASAKRSLRSLRRACASLSWLAAPQPSSAVARVAARACLSGRPRRARQTKPPRAAPNHTAPSPGANQNPLRNSAGSSPGTKKGCCPPRGQQPNKPIRSRALRTAVALGTPYTLGAAGVYLARNPAGSHSKPMTHRN